MYSLAGYGSMITDGVRVDAYTRALRQAIRPGATVLEIGTGPGIFAVFACRLGASRVYAIEPDPIIQVAREIAAANGCAEKIQYIEDLSTRVTLPIQADVIVSDLRGVLPLLQKHVPSIVDARRRFLAPGGVLIPRRDTVWAAIVEAPETYSGIVDCWEKNTLGQDLSPARRLAVNNIQKLRVKPEQMLAPPQLWATLDYASIEDPNVRGRLHWNAKRAGTGHGILAWFDAELADGVFFSNAPEMPEAVYGAMFFPWTRPVPLLAGQKVCVDLAASLIEEDYSWRWKTQIHSAERQDHILFELDQSQFGGTVLSAGKLRRAASDFIPELSEEGRLRLRSLELMDGKTSLEEMARRLAKEFPGRFPRWQQALSYAAACSRDHSR